MRVFLTCITLFLFAQFASAQILDPVKWDFSSKQLSDDEFEIIYTATMENGWFIYSQYLANDDGPIKTSFNYEGNAGTYSLIGKNEENSDYKKTGFDEMFEMDVTKFAKKVDFVQKIKVTDDSKPIKGYLEFMTCDDMRCLPPAEIDFSFTVKKGSTKTGATTAPAKEEKTAPKEAIADVKKIKEKTAKEEKMAPKEESVTQIKPLTKKEEPQQQQGLFDPVKWTASVEKTSDNAFDLLIKANIQDGWYIYSQNIEGDDGPVPTTFYWDNNDAVNVEGAAKEESDYMVSGIDKVFEMEITKYKKEVTFRKNMMVSDLNKSLTGAVEFMVCNDERCLPPAEVPFKVNFANLSALIGDNATVKEEVTAGTNTEGFQYNRDYGKPIGECGDTRITESKGLFSIFILGFLGGLVALLTPCVFPMIPLTVSFFTKGSEDKKKGISNAFLYGFFILAVYVILSIPFHLMDSINPDILNDISTNIWLNLAFFAIFLFFAGSFFGYYELTLPQSWSNKASSAEGAGGILGIFFMALTLALVSFSCTGPILGSLLAGALSSDGGAMQLTAGMGGFGFALALPFGLFAAFPSWMNSLPKSGGWLNTVKVVLGFLEVALAFKFLSNADLVKHWGLLKIEPFLIIWALTFLGLGLYLFGKIKFPHDSPLKKVGVVRAGLGVLSFAFVAYLLTGFMYDEKAGSLKSLTLLSGLAPPACYSWIYPCDCPQNLTCFKDFEEGLIYAKEQNKPIMIDFTGHACVNCRKMEEQVWPKKEVYNLIDENYVLISLYVDEKIDLPEDEQIVVPKRNGGTRKLRTVGQKWAYFQANSFNNNSQPWYVLLSPDGKTLLNNPVGYTPDQKEYADFLRCGLDANGKLRQLENGLFLF